MIRLFHLLEPNQTSSTSLKNNLAKIVFCLLLRCSVLIVNMIAINIIKQFFSLYYLLCLACFIAIIQIIAFIIYRIVIGSHFGNNYDQINRENIQQDSQGQQPLQASNSYGNLLKKQRWIINAIWHLLMFINAGFLLFSFFSISSFTLSTYLYKLRSMLCFVIFQQILSLLFFMSYPYLPIQAKTQNLSKQKVNNQKQIFRIYSLFQVGFLKYLGVSFAIGSLLDYIAYGNSDYIEYKFHFTIFINESRFTFNHLCFYLSLVIIISGVLLARKGHIMDKIKYFIDFQ